MSFLAERCVRRIRSNQVRAPAQFLPAEGYSRLAYAPMVLAGGGMPDFREAETDRCHNCRCASVRGGDG